MGVDVDEFCSGSMEGGGIEVEDRVCIYKCLSFKEVLMVLLGTVDDLT